MNVQRLHIKIESRDGSFLVKRMGWNQHSVITLDVAALICIMGNAAEMESR